MVKKFVISSGHGDKVSGAIGILNERNEAKKVVNEVYRILTKEYNGSGYKYHETTANTQQQNLSNIVNYHNSKDRVLDVSVHFNSAAATATGTECLYYDQRALSAKMSKAMSNSLGIVDRGAKERKELYFLRNTSKPAILLEVCFVTSKKDAAAYNSNFKALCKAIAKVLAEHLGYIAKKTTTTSTSDKKEYHKTTGKYKITKGCYAYKDSSGDKDKRVVSLKKGEVYTAVEVAGNKFKLKSGLYMTANKDYSKRV